MTNIEKDWESLRKTQNTQKDSETLWRNNVNELYLCPFGTGMYIAQWTASYVLDSSDLAALIQSTMPINSVVEA